MDEISYKAGNPSDIENQIHEIYAQSWELRYKDSKRGLELCNEACRLAIETGNAGLIMPLRLFKVIYKHSIFFLTKFQYFLYIQLIQTLKHAIQDLIHSCNYTFTFPCKNHQKQAENCKSLQ